MTVVEFSNPHRVSELPGAHPPALTDQTADVSDQLEAWYRYAATIGDGVLFCPGLRDYRCARPIVWDAPNVSVVGRGGSLTRFVTPGMTIGGEQRQSFAEFGCFQVVSPEHFAGGQPAFPTFKGDGLTVNNQHRANVHDILVVGYSNGFTAQSETARTKFDRISSIMNRNANFVLRGSDSINQGANGRTWLADCHWTQCEGDGNTEAGYMAENGWLFVGNSIGDQFLHGCGSLSAKIGYKVAEPAVRGGYRLNIHLTDGCFADYCSVACLDVRDFAEFKWLGGFLGVRGAVMVGARNSQLSDLTIGNMRDGNGVRDGVILADCTGVAVRNSVVKSFGQGVKIMRGNRCAVESVQVVEMWNGMPSGTPRGHGVLVEDGVGHRIATNVIDTASVQLAAPIGAVRGSGHQFIANTNHVGTPIQVATSTPI